MLFVWGKGKEENERQAECLHFVVGKKKDTEGGGKLIHETNQGSPAKHKNDTPPKKKP